MASAAAEAKKRWVEILFRCKRSTRNSDPVEHECCADPNEKQLYCRPENGSMLVARGAMPPEQNRDDMSHIYVCDLWNMHECTEDACGLYHETTVCPISGIVHGENLVSDLRYREVHMVHNASQARLHHEAEVARQARAPTALRRPAKEAAVIRRIEGATADGTGDARKRKANAEAERALALSLLRRLVDASNRGTALERKMTALLEDREKRFQQKVTQMGQLLVMYPQETRYNGDAKALSAWVGKQLDEFRIYVHEQREAAARQANQEATKTRVKRARQMTHAGSNMFALSGALAPTSVILQEEEAVEEQAVAQEREKRAHKERLARRQQRKKRARDLMRRDAEGRLRVATRRDEIEDEDSELDEEERAREIRDRVSRRAALTQSVQESFTRRCKAFIYHLLWGPRRKKVLQIYQRTLRNEFKSIYNSYINALPKDQLSDLGITTLERHEINNNVYRSPPLRIFPYDDALFKKCVDMVTHVWRVVTQYGPNSFSNAGEIVVVHVVLATLYKVRGHGLIVDGHVIIPPDIRMHHLPQIGDLLHFRQEKHDNMNSYSRTYTLGCQLVTKAFRKALKRGVPVNRLRMELRDMQASVVRDGEEERRNEVEMVAVGRGRLKRRKKRAK